MLLPKYIFSRYRHLINQEGDSLVKDSIKILLICFLAFIGLFVSLVILYVFQERNFLLFRALSLLLVFLFGLAVLLFKSPWTISAHIFVGCLTALVWSNVLFFQSGLTVINVQYTLIILASGYYMIGLKWGFRYALLNFFPLIGELIIDHYLNFTIPIKQLVVNNQAFTITVCFNFLLLMFVHYSFFKALKKSKESELRFRTNLQNALEEAKELATAKTNFLTTMSHELRTPLNAVIGMTNILIMENPMAGQMENLKVLKFSADNLMATVNDIIDFNKINNEKIVLEENPFQLDELVKQIVASLRPLSIEKHLDFKYVIDPALTGLTFSGDRFRLTQILVNLLGTAIKFTELGFVRLDVKTVNHDDRQFKINFTVSDSGIGIPLELQDNIFKPFNQSLSRTSRQFHGALGLTIASQLVQLLKGEIRFESKEGHGSTFQFEISYPISDTQMPTISEPANAEINIKVLVVEDEKINVLVIKKILSKWGIIPDVVTDGQQALDIVIANDYDVILMDINMPVMDGFEASKRIRALQAPHKAGVPIIAVTASIGAAIEQVKSFPFIDDCLLKPFHPEHLREKLIQIASNKR